MLTEERSMNEVNAGFTSMLDPTTDYVDETYYSTLDSQTEQGYSPVSEGFRTAVQEEKNVVLDENLGDILVNEAVDDNTKQFLLEGGHRTVSRDPIPLQVMNDSLDTTMNSDTTETRFQRASLKQQKNTVYKYLAEKQGIVDGTRLNDSSTMLVDLANIGLMFAPYVEQAGVADALANLDQKGEAATALFLMGEGKSHLRSVLANMPVDERLNAMNQVVSAIESGNSLGGVSHDRAIREQLQVALMDEDYDMFDRQLDNLISGFEATGIGALFGATGKGLVRGFERAIKAGKLTGLERKVDLSQVKAATSELSPKAVADIANDDLGKSMSEAIMKDTTDTTAKSLTGTTRNEAIADAATPEPAMPDGSVKSRPTFDSVPADSEGTINRLQEQLAETSVGSYTKKEQESALALKVNNFSTVTGVTTRPEMTTINATETGAEINMVYGTAKGGYSNPTRALNSVEKALSDYNITRDELTLLQKTDEGVYKPIKLEEAPARGDYLVQMNNKYEVNASDVTAWDKYDVKWGFLGKAARYVLDPMSLFDPRLASATAKVDRAAAMNQDLLKLGEKFVETSKRIGPQREKKVWDYLKEANEKGLKLDAQDLSARGFTDEEIGGIKSFRTFWDMHWTIRNNSDVRLMADEGFKVMETPTTRLWGKPATSLPKDALVYDSQTGALKSFSDKSPASNAIDNGELIRLQTPMELDGNIVEYAFSSEKYRTPNPLNDSLTPYREGYFTRTYDAPYFIIKKVKGSDGKTFDKAVATARSTKDAELYMDRMKDVEPDVEVFVRGNVTNPGEELLLRSQSNSTYGWGSQRGRGEKLEDASAPIGDLSDSHLLDPEASMFRSAAAVTNQASMGEFIRAAEKRLLNTYSDVMPKDVDGRLYYPNSLDEIGGKGVTMTPAATDARVMFEYIESLKNGYSDVIDNATKGGMFRIAEIFGKMSTKTENAIFGKMFEGAEKTLLRAGNVANPVGALKSLAFNSYIALNPLRQFTLNVSQTLQLTAINPKFMASPKGAYQSSAMWMKRLGMEIPDNVVKGSGLSKVELDLMFNEYMKSGLPASIAHHNLRRSSLTDMAREAEWSRKTNFGVSKTVDIVTSPLSLSRKIGFEAGEEVNLLTSWLAHYDLVRSTKPALNKTDFFKVSTDTRNFTYNMNRAGDMKYNSSVLSAALQFAQVPHKALMTSITNRNLDKKTKAYLLAINGLMFGLPASFVGYTSMAVKDILGEDPDPEFAQVVTNGLLAEAFNSAMTAAFEGETAVSFKNLSPMDATGVYKTFDALLENNLIDVFKDGAGWSAYGALGDAMTSLTKTLGGEKWADGSDAGVKQFALSVLDMSSGMSNGIRAKLAYDHGVLYGRSGNPRDVSVTAPEAFMAAAGFQTIDEVNKWAMREGTTAFKRERTKDIDKLLDRTYYELAKANFNGDNPEFQIKALSHIFNTMDLTPEERSYVASKVRQRAGGDQDLIGEMLRLFKVQGGAEEADKSMLMRATPEQYQKWKASREAIQSFNQELRGE